MGFVVEYARMEQYTRTSAEWATDDPVLRQGELGIADDGGASIEVRIGDGTSRWSQLSARAIVPGGGGASGVSSFNTRTGAVTLTKADVTGTGLAAADVSALDQTAGDARYAEAADIRHIVKLTSAAYTALGTKDSATLYLLDG